MRMALLLALTLQAAGAKIVQPRFEQVVPLKKRVEILEIFSFRNPAVFVFVLQPFPLLQSLCALAGVAAFADANDVVRYVFPATRARQNMLRRERTFLSAIDADARVLHL